MSGLSGKVPIVQEPKNPRSHPAVFLRDVGLTPMLFFQLNHMPLRIRPLL